MRPTLVLAQLLGFVATSLAYWNGNDTVMGMNLGSYFVPEQWMMWQYFGCNAPSTVNDTWGLQSMPNASAIMTQHLDNYIQERDIADAAAKGINFLRIGVAFWMFIPTEGNEPYWTDPIQRNFYLTRLINWATTYKMQVLIDLHALPGAQNTDEHSGRDLVTAGLQPEFYNSTNLARGNATIDAVIEYIQGLPSNISSTVAMIELANEPSLPTSDSYELLVGYYVANQAKIAQKLPNVWTMIGDAWLGTQSWGDVFNPSQKVVMDLHWWNLFTDIPSLTTLEDTYCSLSPPTLKNAWKNPVLIGEFSGNENGIDVSNMTQEGQLQFYQNLYASQLWAAIGSDGRLPQYRGAFVWSMICTNCADVWEPYWMIGQANTFNITAPNWCNKTQTTPSDPKQTMINPSPTHSYNSCGLYLNQDQTVATATGGSGAGPSASGTSSGASASSTAKKGAAGRVSPSEPSFVLFMFSMALIPAVVGFSIQFFSSA